MIKYQAQLLRTMREREGMTQQHFSDLCGYESRQLISNIERGICYPPKVVLKQMKRFCKKQELSRAIKNDFINKSRLLVSEIFGDQ